MRTTYLLDTPSEAQRLVSKVDAHGWVRKYLGEVDCSAPILEIGSGPMHLLREAIQLIGRPGIGVDISIDRLAHSRTMLPEGTTDPSTTNSVHHTRWSPQPVCAAAEALPLATDTFGLTFARFVAEYLPDPQQSIIEMVRVTKPGCRLVLQDLDGQILQNYPVRPQLQRALEAFVGRTGGRIDPYVGRKLYSFAHVAGVTDITVVVEPYHVIAGAADAQTLARWRLKLSNALPAAEAILGSAEARSLMREFIHYLQDPATLTFSSLFTVAGRCPAK